MTVAACGCAFAPWRVLAILQGSGHVLQVVGSRSDTRDLRAWQQQCDDDSRHGVLQQQARDCRSSQSLQLRPARLRVHLALLTCQGRLMPLNKLLRNDIFWQARCSNTACLACLLRTETARHLCTIQ